MFEKVKAALSGALVFASTLMGGTVTYWLGSVVKTAVGTAVPSNTPEIGFALGAITAFLGSTYALSSTLGK